MVVFLHPLSPKNGTVERGGRKDIERLKQEIACVETHIEVCVETRESKVEEEFLQ